MGKKQNTSSGMKKSLLVGNGVTINFGGNAYTNKFIIKRIIFNAKANKYAPLFIGKISGDYIANVFNNLAEYANDIVAGKYDSFLDESDLDILNSFKERYSEKINHYYDVGLEDWLFILRCYTLSEDEMKDSWHSLKQAFGCMMLDAIYNDGLIQTWHQQVGKNIKRFFSDYDDIFTLNYENNIEVLTGKTVFHLHGDYKTLTNSENPKTIQGYIRTQNDETVVVPGFEHCFCNALLDYSGINKYKLAYSFEKGEAEFYYFSRLGLLPKEYDPWEKTHLEHPEIPFGVKYHFDRFRSLTGELHIIGLSPNNDSHIFNLINESELSKIIYYYHSPNEKSLNISKPVEYKDVKVLWKSLKANRAHYNNKYEIPNTPKFNDLLKALQLMSADEVPMDELIDAVNSIPEYEVKRLCQLAIDEFKRQKEEGRPKDADDLMLKLREISRIALREGVLPSALYVHLARNGPYFKE